VQGDGIRALPNVRHKYSIAIVFCDIEGCVISPMPSPTQAKSPSGNSACATGERRTKRGKDAGRPNSSAIWPTEDAAPRSVRRRQTCAGGFRMDSKGARGVLSEARQRPLLAESASCDVALRGWLR
jgi:hypothetical protein